jgi:NAD-dependent dihydropyrimidine dehydrogenase PreA subunit
MTETNLILIEEACTNCSKCVWSCPVEAIEFDKTKAIKNNEKI